MHFGGGKNEGVKTDWKWAVFDAFSGALWWSCGVWAPCRSDAGDVAQRRRRGRLQPLRLLPATERRHPAGLRHHASHCHPRAPHPAGLPLLAVGPPSFLVVVFLPPPPLFRVVVLCDGLLF